MNVHAITRIGVCAAAATATLLIWPATTASAGSSIHHSSHSTLGGVGGSIIGYHRTPRPLSRA